MRGVGGLVFNFWGGGGKGEGGSEKGERDESGSVCRAAGRDGAQQAEERGESSSVHQTHGDLQHVIPQRKVREALPEALDGFSGAAARFEERFFGIFEARHRMRWRGFAERSGESWMGVGERGRGVYEGWRSSGNLMLQPGAAAGRANVMGNAKLVSEARGVELPRTILFRLRFGLGEAEANIYCAVCTVGAGRGLGGRVVKKSGGVYSVLQMNDLHLRMKV